MPKRAVGEVIRRGRFYAVRYYDLRGRRRMESARSVRREDAERLLRKRLQEKDDESPVDPGLGKLKFDSAATDLENDYKVNGKRSLGDVKRKVKLHVAPYFRGRRMNQITTSEIRAYIATRLDAGAANASINRELSHLKRMFSLAIQAKKLLHRPHIPMLQENNTRRGFFERAQFDALVAHLPEAVRPVVTFAYLTGWRVKSEILPLEWRQVDWVGRMVRLDPGTTKNGEGRNYPFTAALETLLKAQLAEHERLKKQGKLVALLFHRNGKRICNFRRAWDAACTAAGCPDRIPHDFRRTAVRNLELAGVSRSAAMAMVGHKTEAIYRRYAIVDAGALRDAAARIDAEATASPKIGSGTR